MGTLNAIYVRGASEAVIPIVSAAFPSAEIETDPVSPFIDVVLAGDDWQAPESDLLALSLTLDTDVIWLSFQSVTDTFDFIHWYAGKLLRVLVYGLYAERTWERIEGRPEPWEQATFFDPEFLADLLEDEMVSR
jgi:hypothetical protein